jgi:hypothetical protein
VEDVCIAALAIATLAIAVALKRRDGTTGPLTAWLPNWSVSTSATHRTQIPPARAGPGPPVVLRR